MEQELEIKKIIYGGEGLGFLEGKACFVEDVLAGEKVRIKLTQDKKKFARARVVEILTPSPERIQPPCPYISSCGGCQYQHMPYAEELRWKESQVREYLEKQLKLPASLVKSIQGSAEPYGYRSSVTLHAGKNGWGFFARDNTSITPIDRCRLASGPLENLSAITAALAGASEDITLRAAADGSVISSMEDRLFEIRIGKETLWTHSRGFFQNNLAVTEAVAGKIREWLQAAPPAGFMDLYSGAGTFTILSAKNINPLLCAEESRWSLAALEKNLSLHQLEAKILKGRVEYTFPQWAKQKKGAGAFILLDPPRTGLEDPLADFLSNYEGADQIAYLSCHLGSMTRDLQAILAAGRFKVSEVIPFDMFPRTKHIEVLTLLKAG